MCATIEALRANVSKLHGSDLTFANSLLQQSARRSLSPKQMVYVDKLAAKATGTAPVADSKPKGEAFPNVRAMFTRAINDGAKRMAVRLETASQVGLRISLGSDGERLQFSEQGDFETRRYFGYIDRDGFFHHTTRTARDESVMEALKAFDANPMAVAIAYGKRTGSCCMCGTTLTNKVSVEEGIGPICGSRLTA